MSTFLNFLNTADLETLTRISGVNRQLAGAIISARPFDLETDVLQVKGMGKATLTRLQHYAETKENAPETSAMIPVKEEAPPAILERPEPARVETHEQDSFLKRLWRAFKWFMNALLKLIMLALLFAAVGALFAYGLPYIQKTFIAPLERNTAQIQEMEAEIASLQTQINSMGERVTTLEDSVAAHTASLAKLEEMQNTLETQLAENQSTAMLELKHEIMFTRALDVLARARLYLAQSNFGLAKADVETAYTLLTQLEQATEDKTLAPALTRLDLALNNLPDFPVVAAGDLEIAWQILISGNVPAATASPTPLPITETPTPASTAEQTATPTITATP